MAALQDGGYQARRLRLTSNGEVTSGAQALETMEMPILKLAAVRIVSAVRVFGSAARVAGAIESRKAPNPRDLESVGISAAAFSAIGKV
jgi:hypothetical protein